MSSPLVVVGLDHTRHILLGRGPINNGSPAVTELKKTLFPLIPYYKKAPDKNQFIKDFAIPKLQGLGIAFVNHVEYRDGKRLVEVVDINSKKIIEKIGQYVRGKRNPKKQQARAAKRESLARASFGNGVSLAHNVQTCHSFASVAGGNASHPNSSDNNSSMAIKVRFPVTTTQDKVDAWILMTRSIGGQVSIQPPPNFIVALQPQQVCQNPAPAPNEEMLAEFTEPIADPLQQLRPHRVTPAKEQHSSVDAMLDDLEPLPVVAAGPERSVAALPPQPVLQHPDSLSDAEFFSGIFAPVSYLPQQQQQQPSRNPHSTPATEWNGFVDVDMPPSPYVDPSVAAVHALHENPASTTNEDDRLDILRMTQAKMDAVTEALLEENDSPPAASEGGDGAFMGSFPPPLSK